MADACRLGGCLEVDFNPSGGTLPGRDKLVVQLFGSRG